LYHSCLPQPAIDNADPATILPARLVLNKKDFFGL